MLDLMFTVSTGLAVVLCVIPGIVHIQSRNYGAIFMTMWVVIANFISFVNSTIWTDYYVLEDKARIWCLITPPFYAASNFGLLSSATCTIYTMYSYVSSPIILTVKVKQRRAIITSIFAIVLPVILMGLSYTVQLYLYAIRPILGCFSTFEQNWVFFILYNMWPPIIALIGCYYAGRTSFAIIKKRLEIQSLLAYNESGINTSYYYRLVLFCISFLIFALPAALLNTFSNLLEGIVPYNMSNRNFGLIAIFTGEERGVTFIDYAKPLSGFVLFIFFGTGTDAVATYKKWAIAMKLDKVFGRFFKNDVSNETNGSSRLSSGGNLRPFQLSQSMGKQSQRSFLNSPKSPKTFNDKTNHLAPPPNVLTKEKEKKSPFKNILFLNGHRTPSEQAAFDLTSGLRFKIDGIDTATVMPETDEDLHERPAPAYHHQRGILETLEAGDDDVDFGTQRYVEMEDDQEIEEDDDDLNLEYSTPQQLTPTSFGGDVGSVSHLNHLLEVYEDSNVPSINVTPSSPHHPQYATIRVHDTDTFVANGLDDVIDEYSHNRNIESQRSSYSETGIAL